MMKKILIMKERVEQVPQTVNKMKLFDELKWRGLVKDISSPKI